jgi:hypothetical protein
VSTPFVTRAEWGAKAPTSVSRNVTARHLTAHYAGPSPWQHGNMDHSRCAGIWRGFQQFHMGARGWSDIAYTSGVCPHGYRYEGRGPGVRTAANGTNAGNQLAYATCYIAGDNDPLTDDAKRAFLDEALRLAVPLNKVHSDWKPTGCPGVPLRAWVKAGAPAPGGSAPAPAPGPIDWPALRRIHAAKLMQQLTAVTGTLRQGATGSQVRSLQVALNLVTGAGVGEDGQFGPATTKAVVNFQRFFKLPADGVFGPRSRSVMLQVLGQIASGRA